MRRFSRILGMTKFAHTPECIACMLRQALEATEYATQDTSLRYKALAEIIMYLNQVDVNTGSHAKIASQVHRIIRHVTGNNDPYFEIKKKSNDLALRLLSALDFSSLGDNLLTIAIKLSITANNIDYSMISTNTCPEKLVHNVLQVQIDPKKVADLKKLLHQAIQDHSKILYLCDNSGEIVFDKLLISILKEKGADITVAVKEKSVLNDATREDARYVELTKIAKVITTGNDMVGALIDEASPEFLQEFHNANVIIAKGQANFESLVDIKDKPTTIFLFRVKCNLIAEPISSTIGMNEIIIQKSKEKKR
ncbi:damage-control phosphatase ARMT1 family protein [[Eubacterium] cellulosolvens]